MITNPVVGMKVKWCGSPESCRHNQIGSIVEVCKINDPTCYLRVDFGRVLRYGVRIWFCDSNELEALSPEALEQERQAEEKRLDQQRRLEHAMRYL